MGKKAIFLDRDGVINEDRSYVHSIEDFSFIPGVFEALREFAKMGYVLIIVTNQSGIGRGYYTLEDFMKLNEWMLKRFEEEGIEIAEVLFCPHAPDEGCECRKPAPGMILEGIKKHNIDPDSSWMIGDKPTDMEAAIRAGVKGRILIGKNNSRGFAADSLYDTISIIKGLERE